MTLKKKTQGLMDSTFNRSVELTTLIAAISGCNACNVVHAFGMHESLYAGFLKNGMLVILAMFKMLVMIASLYAQCTLVCGLHRS